MIKKGHVIFNFEKPITSFCAETILLFVVGFLVKSHYMSVHLWSDVLLG